MKAAELRELAIDWLAKTYHDSLIVPELSIGSWGAALLDVAAITADEIIGIEIKGEGDSPSRLSLQAAIYSKAATRMFMLPCPALEDRCFKHIPSAWGRLRVRDGRVECKIPEGRQWYLTPSGKSHMPAKWGGDVRAEVLCTAPAQLLQCLWRDELDEIARLEGVITGKVDVETLRWKLAEAIPLEKLRPLVCWFLNHRRWNTDRGSKITIRASERLAA